MVSRSLDDFEALYEQIAPTVREVLARQRFFARYSSADQHPLCVESLERTNIVLFAEIWTQICQRLLIVDPFVLRIVNQSLLMNNQRPRPRMCQ